MEIDELDKNMGIVLSGLDRLSKCVFQAIG
jgi:hypothetical protein